MLLEKGQQGMHLKVYNSLRHYRFYLTGIYLRFFDTLLDMSVEWKPSGNNSYEATHRVSGEKMRSASRVDLVFGSNSQLRSIAEVYASDDAKNKFVSDFIAAWNKVMNADRFDV